MIKLLKSGSVIFAISLMFGCGSDDDTLAPVEATMITVKDFEITMDENPATGQELGAIEATTNRSVLAYTIKKEEPTGAFVIDSKTGKLTVKDAMLFDFESRTTLTAIVQVKNGDLTKEAKIIVTLNDVNDAVITVQDFEATIDENPTIDQELGTIEATIDTGELTYSLTAEEPSGAFAIDAKTGKLTVKDATLFNFETRTALTATVQVNKGKQRKEARVTITINNVIENIVFADANFKNALLAHTNPTIDTNNDGEISDEEAQVIGKIDVRGKNISDLSGIEYFTGLIRLHCANNQLRTLDVRKNTALARLYCYTNGLTILDVSKNTALDILNCSDNRLTDLDVRKNTALTVLSCDRNKLTILDVHKNRALTGLYCYINQLTTLDVRKNTALIRLDCRENQLTDLDVSKNRALTRLSCNTNQLTDLDVSKNTALDILNCGGNKLTTLDVSTNTALTELYCYGNRLTSLNLNNGENNSLTKVEANNNSPSLTCIQVNSLTDPNTYWKKDAAASYSVNCGS
ncbi:cadherin repeat domain-containing protein [Aquimarina sp. MAR_2010_214]|uniref:cadherin repeat domain-containing protein n=1 Tax=Aquimarina sp. MAR_2010_214 TaxID=1250026 RepID=UPI00117775D4|nr:cadherin repeat domain-containing protein [Aquimarina sp. MAR_2010_214]